MGAMLAVASVNKSGGNDGPRGIITPFPGRRATRLKPQAGSPRKGDRLTRSEAARVFSRAQRAGRESSDVSAERLAELRTLIERGEYQPDPREIARKILEHGL